MSSKNNEKAVAVAAAERLKGMSRVQSEKAAASATRNLNAYGQKEEGPSLREVKRDRMRNMYAHSTEKPATLGVRKDVKKFADTSDNKMMIQCQNCYRNGHWSYECKNQRAYVSRPSQTKLIKNPRLRRKLSVSFDGNPDIFPEEEKKDEEVGGKSNGEKHHERSDSESDTRSDSSVSTRSNSSSSSASEYSSSSSSESEEEKRGRKMSYRKRKRDDYSSTSESSDSSSDSGSDSNSDSDPDSSSSSSSDSDSDSYKKKSRRRHRRH